MRGLTPEERRELELATLPYSADVWAEDEEAVTRLIARGLLALRTESTVEDGFVVEIEYADATSAGLLALRLDAAARAMGGPS